MKEKKEEEKREEEKKEEANGGGGDKKQQEEKKEQEEEPLVLKVDMHCEACARKVTRSLKGFQGLSLSFLLTSLFVFIYIPQNRDV